MPLLSISYARARSPARPAPPALPAPHTHIAGHETRQHGCTTATPTLTPELPPLAVTTVLVTTTEDEQEEDEKEEFYSAGGVYSVGLEQEYNRCVGECLVTVLDMACQQEESRSRH